MRAKLDHGASDSHSSKPHPANLDFKLAHLPELPPVLLASMMPTRLFLAQYRRPQYQKAKETGHDIDTETLFNSAAVICDLVLLHDLSTLGKLHLRTRH
jgi:hypothetical protein